MGIFGWSLPPGCTNQMIEEAYGFDEPCFVCGEHPDNCICPECPICGEFGHPKCYIEHGLRRTEEQKFFFECNKREMEKAEAENWKELEEMQMGEQS